MTSISNLRTFVNVYYQNLSLTVKENIMMINLTFVEDTQSVEKWVKSSFGQRRGVWLKPSPLQK